jgi:negative regulator of flagellin synthesis FlgM
MKISDTNALGPVAVTPRQDAKPAPAKGPADTVSSGAAEKLAMAVAVARQSTGISRTARLQELEAAIKSGTYQPDAGRIAQQILDAAQLDARLEALLTR